MKSTYTFRGSLWGLVMALGAGCSGGPREQERAHPEVGESAQAVAGPSVQVSVAARDTSVREDEPDQNFGGALTLRVGDGARALLAVSQPELGAAVGPGDLLVSAKLSLTLAGSRGGPRRRAQWIDVNRVNQTWT